MVLSDQVLIKYTAELPARLFVLVCLISGCSNHAPAPVYDINLPQIVKRNLQASTSTHRISPVLVESTSKSIRSNPVKPGDIYVVEPGDTLFSIAWHKDLDHKELARINRLNNNIIYPGQRLNLTNAEVSQVFNPQSLLLALNNEVLQTPVRMSLTSAPSPLVNAPAVVRQTIVQQPIATKASNLVETKSPQVAVVSTTPKRAGRTNSSAHTGNDSSPITWIWPTDGEILANFSSTMNANRGLDIAGKRGQAVRATAPGRVVYEGNGLRGYGNLVIIKHDNNYLSAYAHNEKVHVTENEFVNAGQRIADVGSSGTNSDRLHFEIRYNGKPVDPLNYLPEKK